MVFIASLLPLLAGLAMPEWTYPLIELDQELMLWLNGMHADWMDPIQWAISQTWVWLPLYLFLLYRIFRGKGWKTLVVALASAGLVIACADLTSVRLFKENFKRPRPSHHEIIGPQMHHVTNFKGELYQGGSYGFVSSHAANFTGIATLLFFVFGGRKKKSNYLLLVWAAVISYSRIYLGVHYPADILGGALLGGLLGWMIYRSTFTYLVEKWEKVSK